ncbi:MAG: hypothetical protein CALGDGBN_01923 [Pseudomonadales bacterium]|nr:hypothetical protein [Pseudomonadales bacterium]
MSRIIVRKQMRHRDRSTPLRIQRQRVRLGDPVGPLELHPQGILETLVRVFHRQAGLLALLDARYIQARLFDDRIHVVHSHGDGALVATAVVVLQGDADRVAVVRCGGRIVVLVGVALLQGAAAAVAEAGQVLHDGRRAAVTPVDRDPELVEHADVVEVDRQPGILTLVDLDALELQRLDPRIDVADLRARRGSIGADHVVRGHHDRFRVGRRSVRVIIGVNVRERRRAHSGSYRAGLDRRAVPPGHRDRGLERRIGGNPFHIERRRVALVHDRRDRDLEALRETDVIEEIDLADQGREIRIGKGVALVEHDPGRTFHVRVLELQKRHLALELLGHRDRVGVATEERRLQLDGEPFAVLQIRIQLGREEAHLELGRCHHHRRHHREREQRLVRRHHHAIVRDGIQVGDLGDDIVDELTGDVADGQAQEVLDHRARAHHQCIVGAGLEQILEQLLQVGAHVLLEVVYPERVQLLVRIDLDQVLDRLDRRTCVDQLVEHAGGEIVERRVGIEDLAVLAVVAPVQLVPVAIALRAARVRLLRLAAEEIELRLRRQRADRLVDDQVPDLAQRAGGQCPDVGFENEQPADVERAHRTEVDIEPLAAVEGPARQFVGQREAVLVRARQQPVQQRLAGAVLEVAVEHVGHRVGALGDLRVVVGERYTVAVPDRAVRSRTATAGVVPPGPDALPDRAGAGPLGRRHQVVGRRARHRPVPRLGIEIEHRNAQGTRADALVDDAPEHRVAIEGEQVRARGSGVPLPDAAVRTTDAGDAEVLAREAGDAVHEEIEVGALDETAVRCRCYAGTAAGGLVVVVEVTDVGPALDVRILEVVVGDVQRDAHHVDQREQPAQPQFGGGQCSRGRRHDEYRDRCRDRQRVVHEVEHVAQRHRQRFLLEVVRIKRGHVDIGDFRVPHAEPLRDLAVHHGPAAVADEVQRRGEQLVSAVAVQRGKRGVQRFGSGLGEAAVTDVGLLAPVRDQHHGLAVLQHIRANRGAVGVAPLARVLVVQQHHAAAGRVGDQACERDELRRVLERGVAGRGFEVEAVRDQRDAVVRTVAIDRLRDEAGGFDIRLTGRNQLDPPVVALARGKQCGRERQVDAAGAGQHLRGPDPVRVAIGPGVRRIRVDHRRQRALHGRIVGPQTFARSKRTDEHLHRVIRGAEQAGIHIPAELERHAGVVQILGSQRVDQRERIGRLHRQAARELPDRDTRQVDRLRRVGVVGQFVHRIPGEIVAPRRGCLLVQVRDIEHQHVAGVAVQRVELGAVRGQFQIGRERQRDRRRRGEDLRPGTERVLDDADLGTRLVGVHVLDPETRIVGAHAERHTPVADIRVREIRRHDDVVGVTYVQLVFLVAVARQLQIDPPDIGVEGIGRAVADLDYGQPHVALPRPAAAQPRDEGHAVRIGGARDPHRLDATVEFGDHLAPVARVGGRIGRRPVVLVDVDHHHRARIAPAERPGLRSPEQFGRRRRQPQPRAIGVQCDAVDLVVRRRDCDRVDDAVQILARPDVDDVDRRAGRDVEVAPVRIELHGGGTHPVRERDEVQRVRCRRGIGELQPDAVDDPDSRRLVGTGLDREKRTRQIGGGGGIDDVLPQIDLLDDLFDATLLLGLQVQDLQRPVLADKTVAARIVDRDALAARPVLHGGAAARGRERL